MVTMKKENRVLDLLTRFSRLSKIVRILGYVKRFVKKCRIHPRLDFQAAAQNVAYATTATGGIQTRYGIERRLGLGTEESDDAGKVMVQKQLLVQVYVLVLRIIRKTTSFDTRFGIGTNVRLQTVSYRDGNGR